MIKLIRIYAVGIILLLGLNFKAIGQSLIRGENPECFMLLVGKKASMDGTVLLGHNNDLTGEEPSIVVKYPAQDHLPYDSVRFPSGLALPQVLHTLEWMALQIAEGFKEGDAVAINEYGVCIAGGVALKADRNSRAAKADPLIKNGLTGGIRYIALQRSKTARECVRLLGSMYNRYGVTYPSGVGIADSSEIWYVESGGGYSWAAVRVPDSCYWVQANGYRIGPVDPNDTMNCYCSPDLKEFCFSNELWNGESEFSFAKAFGGGRLERNEKPYYDSRRIWQALQLITPSLELAPNQNEIPLYLVPDQKISLPDCFALLRNRYENTPFGNQVDDTGINGERPIGSWSTVHTDVIQLHPGKPVDYGTVLWAGIGPPMTCFYSPIFFGIDSVPNSYQRTTQTNSGLSAFEVFHNLAVEAKTHPQVLAHIKKEQTAFENEMINRVDNIYKMSETNQQPNSDYRYQLNKLVYKNCGEAYRKALDMVKVK